MQQTQVDRRWVTGAMAGALVFGVYALGVTRDWRAGVLGTAVSAAVNLWMWRPGGPGHRIGRREQAREAAGVPMVRTGWAVGLVCVLVVVIASALVGGLFLD